MNNIKQTNATRWYARLGLIVFLFFAAFTAQSAQKKIVTKPKSYPTLADAYKALAKEQANQAAGIVADVPGKKTAPAAKPQQVAKYTQTEALMSLPFIQDLIKKNYPNYLKYSNIIDACKAREKQFKDGYYVFYHAYDNQWRVPQDLYKQLYVYYHPTADIPDTFTFLRFIEQSTPKAQAFLIEEIKKYGLINDNDPHRMLLLSTNLALFGNVGYANECTWTYFIESTSHADVNREIYERILDTYSLTYQYISEFTKLEKLLEKASKEQTLLQVFIPINRVDEVAYLSWVRGIPAHEKTIDLVLKGIPTKQEELFRKVAPALDKLGQIYQAQQEKHPIFKDLMESIKKGAFSVNAFLKIYRNTPEKLEEINDFSARLLLSKDYLLSPLADVKMYRYVTTPSPTLKEYYATLNDLVNKIVKEKEERPVTVEPLEVKPLNKAELEKKFGEVAAVYGEVSKDRQELQTLRDTYIKEYSQKGMQGNCMQITGKITQATMTYINKRIAETVKKVGPAPTKFSVFTMGSMARDESGFYTDLEIGILVAKKDPAILTYFRKFSQELADRFFKLGEHPDVGGKGLRVDEEDNAPDHLRWYARYASPEEIALLSKTFGPDTSKSPQEGSRIFVATPQEFARYLEPNAVKNLVGATGREQDIVSGISALVRNMRHLYGDKALFDQYMKEREVYLKGPSQTKSSHYTNRREEIAYQSLEGDVRKHDKADSPITLGKLGDTIDPKRKLYRFPEQVLTNLGFWYNVGVQNTVQIADKLVATKHMSPEWGNALKDLMNFTMCLRLRKQMTLGKQGFAIPVTQKGYNDLKREFTNDLDMATRNLASAKNKKDQKAITQAEDDVLHAQVSIKDLDNMIPGKADSIISPEIIKLLNTKYLPLEKKLLGTVQKFLAGDKNAFLGTDIGIPAR